MHRKLCLLTFYELWRHGLQLVLKFFYLWLIADNSQARSCSISMFDAWTFLVIVLIDLELQGGLLLETPADQEVLGTMICWVKKELSILFCTETLVFCWSMQEWDEMEEKRRRECDSNSSIEHLLIGPFDLVLETRIAEACDSACCKQGYVGKLSHVKYCIYYFSDKPLLLCCPWRLTQWNSWLCEELPLVPLKWPSFPAYLCVAEIGFPSRLHETVVLPVPHVNPSPTGWRP